MATKISSDISTNVDITCRKGDTFSLDAAITNSDGSIFDLSGYLAEFIVTNANDNTVRKFYSYAGSSGTIDYYSTISLNNTTGIISINVTGVKMNVIEGQFKYILRVSASSGDNTGNIHTLLDGKFRVIN
tara:strand:- start:653 stop:1042 length:390 start_codon:yes stop_codon:yes gene_type:complete